MKRAKKSFERFRSFASLIWIAASALVLLGAATGLVAQGIDRSEFHLEDQFGIARSSAEVRGQVLVLIGGNRKAGKQCGEWAHDVLGLLQSRPEWEGGVAVLRVADLREFPRALEPAVVAALRKKYEQAVLLDWDGDLSGTYEFQSKGSNVVVVDPEGTAILRISGQSPVDPLVGELEAVLSRTLRRSMTGTEDLDRLPLEGAGTQQTGSPQAADSLEGEMS